MRFARFAVVGLLLVLASHAAGAAKERGMLPTPSRYDKLRNGLSNSRIRMTRDKEARVAMLGGSISEARGWRVMTCEMLRKRFPDTKFDFVNAGISSTDTAMGPFRLKTTVFCRGKVDLLFVEFAVNDDTNGRSVQASIRGMEGIVRQARRLNPAIDVVHLHFVDPGKMAHYRKGETPSEIAAHEKVADHYGNPSIALAREVTERIDAGEFDWKTFGGLHPKPFGHRLYTKSIERLLDAAWKQPLSADAKVRPHPVSEPLGPRNYERGRFVPLEQATLVKGWTLVPRWIATQGGTRKQFVRCPVLEATAPGAELKLKFTGTAVGLLEVAGPDVGIVEFSIDGGPFRRLDQFTKWSGGLHLPWVYILDADLAPGPHELTLRTTDSRNPRSKGHASRIVQFLAN